MNNTTTQKHVSAAPAIRELAALDQWVTWRFVTRQGKDGKPQRDKVPFNAATSQRASHSDPAQWTSYGAALLVLHQYTGLGFVFSKYDPYCGIDLDGCRDAATGTIAPWAWEIITEASSYTEVSPSGTGVKIYGRGHLAAALSKKYGAHCGIECYSQARYFCVTGQHLASTPDTIGPVQHVLDRLAATFAPAPRPAPAPPAAARVSLGEYAADRLSGGEAIARFNQQHPIESLLEQYGAVQTKSGGWACNCGQAHSHGTQLRVLSGRKIVSYSDSCGWAPHYSTRRACDAFELYTRVEHAGNKTAALQAINPYPTRPAASQPTAPEYVLAPAEQARRAAHNAQRRAQRAATNRADLEQLEEHIAQLELPDRAHLVAAFLLDLANATGQLQVRPTNAHICTTLGMKERTVQRAFADLAAAGLGVRRGGTGGLDRPNECAVWTWNRDAVLRVTAASAPAPAAASIDTLVKHEHVSLPESHEHVSALPIPAPVVASQPDRALTPAAASDVQPGCHRVAGLPEVIDDAPDGAYYDPALASQPPAPAQRHERPAWQRTGADVQPLVFDEHSVASESQPAAPAAPGAIGGMRPDWRPAYRLELQALSPGALAGEMKKQQRSVGKAERECLPWLPRARARLELVYEELKRRRPPASTSRSRRPRGQARAGGAPPAQPRAEHAPQLEQLVLLERDPGAASTAARSHAHPVSSAAIGIAGAAAGLDVRRVW